MSLIKHDHFSTGDPDMKRFKEIADVFENNRDGISAIKDTKGSGGNEVLSEIRPELEKLGFRVERSKKSEDQIQLSTPSDAGQESKYYVDGYHPDWGFVLEVEGGRRDAIYKDLVKGLLLREASTLVIAVPTKYDYGEGTPQSDNRYELARREAGAIHNTPRFDSPCDILVIGY